MTMYLQKLQKFSTTKTWSYTVVHDLNQYTEMTLYLVVTMLTAEAVVIIFICHVAMTGVTAIVI